MLMEVVVMYRSPLWWPYFISVWECMFEIAYRLMDSNPAYTMVVKKSNDLLSRIDVVFVNLSISGASK